MSLKYNRTILFLNFIKPAATKRAMPADLPHWCHSKFYLLQIRAVLPIHAHPKQQIQKHWCFSLQLCNKYCHLKLSLSFILSSPVHLALPSLLQPSHLLIRSLAKCGHQRPQLNKMTAIKITARLSAELINLHTQGPQQSWRC